MARTESRKNQVGVTEVTIGDGESALSAVIRGLSQATGESEIDIPPLYDSIDPDALDDLHSTFDGDFKIELEHYGYAITIRGDTVDIQPA